MARSTGSGEGDASSGGTVDPSGAFLRPGMVTGIGSLPHRDPDEAAAFTLRYSGELPAAPQLPGRSPLEGMVAQAARVVPGVELSPDGVLRLVAELDPSVAPYGPMFTSASHAGLLAFLAAAAGRSGPVKLQLTGPLTLGWALVQAGAAVDAAFAAAVSAVRAEGRALVDLVGRRLPGAPLLVVVDEPVLVGELPVPAERRADLLSGALAALEDHAVTGVHCCGPTDWRIVSAAGPTVLSLPVDAVDPGADAAALADHLDRGGWIAWGAVPTTGPIGTGVARLWRRLQAAWAALEDAGCDPLLLREQALITPACGLAAHGPSQAARALRLAQQLGARVAEAAERLHPSSVW